MKFTSRPLTKRKDAILHILAKRYKRKLLWDLKKPLFGVTSLKDDFRVHPIVELTRVTQESLDSYLRKLDY